MSTETLPGSSTRNTSTPRHTWFRGLHVVDIDPLKRFKWRTLTRWQHAWSSRFGLFALSWTHLPSCVRCTSNSLPKTARQPHTGARLQNLLWRRGAKTGDSCPSWCSGQSGATGESPTLSTFHAEISALGTHYLSTLLMACISGRRHTAVQGDPKPPFSTAVEQHPGGGGRWQRNRLAAAGARFGSQSVCEQRGMFSTGGLRHSLQPWIGPARAGGQIAPKLGHAAGAVAAGTAGARNPGPSHAPRAAHCMHHACIICSALHRPQPVAQWPPMHACMPPLPSHCAVCCVPTCMQACMDGRCAARGTGHLLCCCRGVQRLLQGAACACASRSSPHATNTLHLPPAAVAACSPAPARPPSATRPRCA